LPDESQLKKGLTAIEKRREPVEFSSGVSGDGGTLEGEGEAEARSDNGIPVFSEGKFTTRSAVLPDGLRLNEGSATVERRDAIKSLPVAPEGRGAAKGKPEATFVEEIPVFSEGELVENEILPDESQLNKGLTAIEKRREPVEFSSVVSGDGGTVEGEGEAEAISDDGIPVFNEGKFTTRSEVLPDES
jgi:hypothetical protein